MRKFKLLLMLFIIIFIISGCEQENSILTATTSPAQINTSEGGIANDTPVMPPTITSTVQIDTSEGGVAKDTPVVSPTITSTPFPAIIHQSMPNQPEYFISQFIRDCSTGRWVVPGEKIERSYNCDSWHYNAVERPYDQDLEIFYPEFDIITMQLGQDEVWMYARFEIFENSSTEYVEGVFALELDLNLDLRGDILLLASKPVQGDWTTDGVQVWEDTNGDTGGLNPLVADFKTDNNDPGNGYDLLIFDQGKGEDPDSAWMRLSPDDPKIIEIAFKRSLINNSQAFEWWGWASRNPLLPEEFDLNDHFSESEVFVVDNSCGWLFGLDPDTTIPNLCYIEPTPTQTPVPTAQGCVQPPQPTEGCSWIWDPDICKWVEYC